MDQDGVLTCSIGLLTYSTSTEATLKLLQGMVSDNNGNQNEETQSNAIEIDGDTYTATISKEGVTGITELKTTKTSCTTTGRQQNCYAYADSRSAYEVKTGYLSAMGFSTVPNDDVSNGQNSHKINEDITLYPVTAFVFVAAYTYDETKDASDYCVTGEEETCVETIVILIRLQMLARWVRLLNIMQLTLLFLGIFMYYTIKEQLCYYRREVIL